MDPHSLLLLIPVNSFAESPSPRSVDLTVDIVRFLYGSLPRPPDLQSIVVCTWFLNSLSKPIVSGYLYVDDAVAIWKFPKHSCIPREIKIWLDSFQQNLEYEIEDRWLVMLLELHVFTFRTNLQLVSREGNKDCLILFYELCKFARFRFFVESSTKCCDVVHALYIDSADGFQDQYLSRQGENLKLATVMSCLDLCRTDYYGFLYLESIVCERDLKILMSFGGLQVIDPLEDGSFAGLHATEIVMFQLLSLFFKTKTCCFEALLNFVSERLLQFHSCVEAHMGQMKRSSPILEMLFRFHSYVSAHMRQMEWKSSTDVFMGVVLWSCLKRKNGLTSKWFDLHVRIWPRLATFIHEAGCDFVGHGFCFKQRMFFWLKCTQIHSDVVFALRATLEMMLKQNLLQPHITFSFIHLLTMWNQALFCLCRESDYGVSNCWWQWYELLLQQSLPPEFLPRYSGDYVKQVFALNATHKLVLKQILLHFGLVHRLTSSMTH